MAKNTQKIKLEAKKRRARRSRSKMHGTAEVPRLSVFKSLKHIYAQIIDDNTGKTLVSVSDQSIKFKGKKTEAAIEVGKKLAELAAAKSISSVVFDRGSFRYHGRIKALAEAAREAGLKF